MHRTPPANRKLLETAGYVWNADLEGWHRHGEQPSTLQGRVLDADIACSLTSEQIATWIKAGEP